MIFLCNGTDVDKQQPEQIPEAVRTIMQEFQELFSIPHDLPPRRSCDHSIPLIPGAQPINIRAYRHSPETKDEIEKQIEELLKSGVIQHSSSPFASPVILVRKKGGEWCMCIDYRRLNALTVPTKFPIPVIDELLDELAGASWFSKLDLRAGYHQIRLAAGEEFKQHFTLIQGIMSIQLCHLG